MKVLLVDQIATVNYKYSYSLANALLKCGNHIEIVIDDKENNEDCFCKVHRKFNTARKDINKLKKIINYFQSYKFIMNETKRGKYDILHVEWFQVSPIDYVFLKRMKISGLKIVISVHDILPFNEKFYDRFFHKKIYQLADYIIVQAENNLQRFKKLYKDCTEKVSYVPHGNFIEFAEKCEKNIAKEYLNIPDGKTVLLFFGQIKKTKGVGILLEAFGQITQERNDIYLIIAGNVWKDDLKEYEDIIKKYNLSEDCLRFDMKYIPDDEIKYYFSACDLVVLPYIDVYQSGVIQLVYAYERTAIVSRLDSFTEIVKDGENGFVCEKESIDSLQNTIIRAAERKDDFNDMAQKGKELIMERYSWEKIAKQITDIYNKII